MARNSPPPSNPDDGDLKNVKNRQPGGDQPGQGLPVNLPEESAQSPGLGEQPPTAEEPPSSQALEAWLAASEPEPLPDVEEEASGAAAPEPIEGRAEDEIIYVVEEDDPLSQVPPPAGPAEAPAPTTPDGLREEDILRIIEESNLPAAAAPPPPPIAEAAPEEEVIHVTEEPEATTEPPGEPPPAPVAEAPPAQRRGASTHLASRAVVPTMLAPKEEAAEAPGAGLRSEPAAPTPPPPPAPPAQHLPEPEPSGPDSSLDLASLLGERTTADSGAESALVVSPDMLEPESDLPVKPPSSTSQPPSSSVLSTLAQPPEPAPIDTPVHQPASEPEEEASATPPPVPPESPVRLEKFPNLSLDEPEPARQPKSGAPELVPEEAVEEELVEVQPASGVSLGDKAGHDEPTASESGVVIVESEDVTEPEQPALPAEAPEVIEVADASWLAEEPKPPATAAPSSGAVVVDESMLVEEELEPLEPAASASGNRQEPTPVEVGAEDVVEELEEAPASSGKMKSSQAESPSGIDVIAEALESGVDIDKTAAPEPLAGEAADKVAIADEVSSEDDESSAVDLGSGAGVQIPSGLESHPLFTEDSGQRLEPPVPIRSQIPANLEETQAFEEKPPKSAKDLEATQAFTAREEEEASKVRHQEVATIDESLLEQDEPEAERPAPPLPAGEHREVEEVVKDDVFIETPPAEEEVVVEENMLIDEPPAEEVIVDEDMLTEKAAEEEENLVPSTEEPEEDEDLVGVGASAKAKPKAGRKGARQVEEEEEMEEVRPRAKGRKGGDRPRYGRRWLGGLVLGIALAGGLIAATPHIPEARQFALSTLFNINTEQKPAPKVPPLSDLQLARASMDKKDYDDAISRLENANSPEEWSARGEARWLKYLKTQREKKAVLSPDDEEVKLALKDLLKADNDLLQQQILSTLDQQKTSERLRELEKSDKTLRDLILKEKAATPDDLKNLPKVVGDVLAAKSKYENLAAGVAKVLVDGKFLDDPQKLDVKGFGDLFKDLSEAKKAITEVENVLKVKADAAAKTIGELLAARKDLDEKITKVNEQLKKARVDDKDTIKGISDLVAGRDRLAQERQELELAIREALKELKDGQPVPPGVDLKKELVADAALLREKARSPLVNSLTTVAASFNGVVSTTNRFVQQMMERGSLEVQLKFYQAREPLIQPPEQKIDTLVTLFREREQRDPKALADADKVAKWLLSPEAKAGPEMRAKAIYLEGLMARSQEKYDQARQRLDLALKEAGKLLKAPDWRDHCSQTLRELSDASVYFLPRAQQFHAAGQFATALQELTTALKVLPEDPRLLALRCHVRLDQAQAGGMINAQIQAEIQKDAEGAKKDPKTLASALFALGRLAEELQQFDQAEQHYRAALKAHQGTAEERGVYLAALGRLLQRERPPMPVPPPGDNNGKAKNFQVGRLGGAEESEPAEDAFLVVAVQPVPVVEDEMDEKTKKQLEESLKLAEELLKLKAPKLQAEGHFLRGKAYSRMGRRTEGLREFIEGLKKLHPGQNMNDLAKLVEQHPAFQQPDILPEPKGALARVHFGKGLHLYWSREYAQAEAQFKKAVEFDGLDARYRYFLGLAQLAQKTTIKRDAAHYSFEQGARLEAQELPTSVEVNASLERIQGPLRQYLNRFRQKARAGE